MTGWADISYNLPTIADITEFMFYNPGNASSVIRVGYYGRGVWELPINVSQAPLPDFIADKQVVCPNTNVTFTDLSVGNPTGWSWSFPGGSPSSSSLQNPIVNYSSPGVYAVTLTVTNGNGSNSVTQNGYITVSSAATLPIAESFSVFLPGGWTQLDDGQDGVVWQQNTGVGGYGSSSECTFFDNYNHDVAGKKDELLSKTFNTLGSSHPVLTFDVAYARYDATYSDTLDVLVSADCGQTFSVLYSKGGPTLATAPDNSNLFTPTASQWRTDTIDLSPYGNSAELLVAFQNKGHYGNAIYLDNINLYTAFPNGISSNNSIEWAVYPNPASETVYIHGTDTRGHTAEVSLTDLGGKTVLTTTLNDHEIKKIGLDGLAKGIYLLRLSCGTQVNYQKLVVQ